MQTTVTVKSARVGHNSANSWGQRVATFDLGGPKFSGVAPEMCATRDPRAKILYWRHRGKEVDFVIQRGPKLTALEVKSGRRRDGLPGMTALEAAHGPTRKLLVGGDGTPLEAFLATSEIEDI